MTILLKSVTLVVAFYNSPYIALNNSTNNSVSSMSGNDSIGLAPGYGISGVAFGIIFCAAVVGLISNRLS